MLSSLETQYLEFSFIVGCEAYSFYVYLITNTHHRLFLVNDPKGKEVDGAYFTASRSKGSKSRI